MNAYRWRRAADLLLGALLEPGLCLACGAAKEGLFSLCPVCRERLPMVPSPCAACAQPSPLGAAVCPACLANPPRWQRLVAPLDYAEPVRDYLHRLKYGDALHLARTLGEAVLPRLRGPGPAPEVLLPVPLHRRRLCERGYNQAAEIAATWSLALQLPVDRRALTRRRDTPAQAGLTRAQRRDNLRGAFAYAANAGYRHVAVVDDIVTTGSTAEAITRALHLGGVESVEISAVARSCRR